MLLTVNLFMLAVVILFLILSIEQENMIYSVISLMLSGTTMLFWSEWDVISGGSELSYTAPDGIWGIPLIFAVVSFIIIFYLASERFKTEVDQGTNGEGLM